MLFEYLIQEIRTSIVDAIVHTERLDFKGCGSPFIRDDRMTKVCLYAIHSKNIKFEILKDAHESSSS